MFSKIIVTALAFVAATSAAPLAPATVTTCTGTLSPPEGCVAIPIVADTCTSFTGGLSFLYQEITEVAVPAGFVCTFYEDAGCTGEANGEDTVVLQGGNWDMFSVPGVAGNIDFNDKAASFTCSPV